MSSRRSSSSGISHSSFYGDIGPEFCVTIQKQCFLSLASLPSHNWGISLKLTDQTHFIFAFYELTIRVNSLWSVSKKIFGEGVEAQRLLGNILIGTLKSSIFSWAATTQATCKPDKRCVWCANRPLKYIKITAFRSLSY